MNESIGVGIQYPIVSVDISYADAIRIPRGTTIERPTTTDETTNAGYIRYNTTNHQFEGYGPGDSWGSLGGVINVAQNTKVVASYPNADSTNNELMFFTANADSSDINDSTEQMRITSSGDVSMNNRLFVSDDVSFNSKLYVATSLGIGVQHPFVTTDISFTDAIRIPRGSTSQRPDTTNTDYTHHGYIRYNIENQQFEGFGPGNSWGSLGGVINVAQNTKILASYPDADSSNNELIFYTAPAADTSSDSATERMRITAEGNVGINTYPNFSYKLDVNGAIQGTSFNASSDRRLKTNIVDISDALTRVNRLRGVSFQWNKKPGKEIFGVIAQEVEEVIPELVHTNDTENEDGFKQKSIHYDGITPYLIEAIKTLTHQQTDLKEEVETLKQENKLLKENMDKYDALFEQLTNK